MELTDLKIFLTVADEGNFSKSARKLGYVQSNITSRIKKLEEELGNPLFHRHPKGVSLTNKGEIFYEHAASITKRAQQAIEAVKETDDFTGTLTIGTVETLSTQTFMSILSDFQREYPNVALSLNTGTSPTLSEKVEKYQLDAAFVTGEINTNKLAIEYTIEDTIALISAKDIESDNFPETWVVFPEGCPFRKLLYDWAKSENQEVKIIIEVTTLDTLLNCVKAGLASAVLPISVIGEEQKENYEIKLLPDKFKKKVTHLIRPKELEVNKVLASFIEKIEENEL